MAVLQPMNFWWIFTLSATR